jgi:hypothetical protein
MITSLLAAGISTVSFAQPRFDRNNWDNSYYGIAGGDVSNDFCHHLPQAAGPAPTVKEAIASAVCSGAYTYLEHGRLVLIDDLKITIGVADKTLGYPLSGSFTLYECEHIPYHPGSLWKNCNSVEYPEATGTCRKGTSGSWQCHMDLKYEPPTGDRDDPNGKWANQWTHREVSPPEPPEPAKEGMIYVVYIAPEGLPFTTSLLPVEEQVAVKGSAPGVLAFEGERAAVRLKANTLTQFRIRPKPGDSSMGVRFSVQNGARTTTSVPSDVPAVDPLPMTMELIGPVARIMVVEPLAPGEYGLLWGTTAGVHMYVFGVD